MRSRQSSTSPRFVRGEVHSAPFRFHRNLFEVSSVSAEFLDQLYPLAAAALGLRFHRGGRAVLCYFTKVCGQIGFQD